MNARRLTAQVLDITFGAALVGGLLAMTIYCFIAPAFQ